LRVVITRSASKADGMAVRLRELGAEPIIYPTIAYAPPEDAASLDATLARLAAGDYDWLILTSAQAVKAVAERARSAFNLQDVPFAVAAVGPATAKSCAKLLGVAPTAVPEQFIAEGLAAALGDLTGKKSAPPQRRYRPPGVGELPARRRGAGGSCRGLPHRDRSR